ncbi:hypothetical protein B0J11DRAFT_64141 [Dendryphion nanum]|uniref:F-box domain-containing protein n=1 Tax=Dendryphion nanum TaxID=256645 RepID=A0A9P9DHL7_9PLEO|nr:hypothetical protein B0J11DRAFT_64141 [Dendryphion nanum]
MGLLDLPLEVLDEVIALSLPEGIEALAVTCKAVYQRAGSRIHQHNTLKREWRHARITRSPQSNALHLLHAIDRTPLVADYIESLTLSEGTDTALIDANAGASIDFRTQEEAMERIKSKVIESGWAERAGVDSHEWWETLKNEDTLNAQDHDAEAPMCTVVALLAQLPNLTTLRLSPAWSTFGRYVETDQITQNMLAILGVMVEHANAGNEPSRPLAKLTTVLPFMPEGYEERAGLQALQPFMPLESLKQLYAVSCIAVDDGYTGIPFAWRSRGQICSLTRIELAYCCMDAEGISALISRTPYLEVFKYSHQTKWHGCLHDWNPGTFNAALAQHCGQTINELALTIDTLYGDIENGASSFLSFPNLQRLEVDVLIFCGPPVESGQRRGTNGTLPSGQKPWNHEDIPCIGSMLPDNIVEVHINTDYPDPDEHALFALLKNIKPQRAERLKKLDKVIIRQAGADTARKMVEKAEVTLVVFSEEDVSRDMLPQWKRDFASRVGGI